jgi:hypothetical protein
MPIVFTKAHEFIDGWLIKYILCEFREQRSMESSMSKQNSEINHIVPNSGANMLYALRGLKHTEWNIFQREMIIWAVLNVTL